MAKSYARISALSTAGGLAGAGIGALALGNRGAKRIVGGAITAGKKITDRFSGMASKKIIGNTTPRAVGRYIKSRVAPWGAGAAAGAIIGHHIGGEVGEYAGIKGSVNDLQKKSMEKNTILSKLIEMIEG